MGAILSAKRFFLERKEREGGREDRGAKEDGREREIKRERKRERERERERERKREREDGHGRGRCGRGDWVRKIGWIGTRSWPWLWF